MESTESRQQDTLQAIAASDTIDALETVRVDALGKKGWVSALLKTLGKMSPEERQVEGPKIQGVRAAIADAIAARKAELEAAELEARLASETLDLTLPAPASPKGSVHPVSQVMDELAEIFADLGFAVATGPEIEDDWHNFTALNMAETHPARAMHDTFYFPDHDAMEAPASSSEAVGEKRRMLLRTHTSPVQIRAWWSRAPDPHHRAGPRLSQRQRRDAHADVPPGRRAGDRPRHPSRAPEMDAETFLKAFFERDDIVLRLRPSYFPFTEPSVEVDVGWKDEKGRRVLGATAMRPAMAGWNCSAAGW